MKTCKDVADVLTDYLDGVMPPEDKAELQHHIGDCPACEAFIRSFKVATDATRKVLLAQMPSDFDQRLQQFLRTRIAQT